MVAKRRWADEMRLRLSGTSRAVKEGTLHGRRSEHQITNRPPPPPLVARTVVIDVSGVRRASIVVFKVRIWYVRLAHSD